MKKETVVLNEVGKVEVEASPKYSINKSDVYKAVRGMGIILLAALIAAVTDVYTKVDYSYCVAPESCINFTAFVVPFIATLLEIGRRFVTAQATAKNV